MGSLKAFLLCALVSCLVLPAFGEFISSYMLNCVARTVKTVCHNSRPLAGALIIGPEARTIYLLENSPEGTRTRVL